MKDYNFSKEYLYEIIFIFIYKMEELYNSIKIENIIDYQEYYLIKENKVYKLITGKIKNKILIKSKN